MRSGDRSMRGALWAIAHSVAAAADALEAGVAQRLDEIDRGLQEFTERQPTAAGHIRDREAPIRELLRERREQADVLWRSIMATERPDPTQGFTIPDRGVIHIVPIPPEPPFATWSTGVVVDSGTYRIIRIDDYRPEGETS